MKALLPLLLAAVSLPLFTSAANAEPGEFGSLAILLGVDAVRKELQVTPAQAARLDSLRDQYRASARSIVASTANKPAATAKKDLDAATARSNKAALAVLDKTQRGQLAKIEKNYLGAHLLYSPDVQRRLGLSADQSSRIAGVKAAHQAEQNRINSDFEAGRITAAQRVTALRGARMNDSKTLLKILTPAQRETFRSLE